MSLNAQNLIATSHSKAKSPAMVEPAHGDKDEEDHGEGTAQKKEMQVVWAPSSGHMNLSGKFKDSYSSLILQVRHVVPGK